MLTGAFSVQPADLDESIAPGESPAEYVERVASEKAAAIAGSNPAMLVLGADTTVVLEGRCLGKPGDADDARCMLGALSGRWHEVYSAVALVEPGAASERALSVTRVRFERLPESWIERYVDSGDPMDKAGAYAIQGEAAGWISAIRGSYSGVVGLPLYETGRLLRRAGWI